MQILTQLSEANIVLCASVNPDGVITHENAVFGAYFKNCIGKNLNLLIDPACANDLLEVWKKAKQTPGKYHLLQIRARIVGNKWAIFSLEVFYDTRRDSYGLIGFKVAENIDRAALLLDRYRNRMAEIAYIQSHEVRAPLARILGLTQLQKESQDIEELKRLAVLIWDSSSELDLVIKKNVGLTFLEE